MLAPEIFTRARVWPRPPSAHHKRGRGLRKILRVTLRNWLIQHMRAYNFYKFVGSGCKLTKLYQGTYTEACVITCIQILEGCPNKIWEGKKTSKIRRDFWQLSTLIANISGKDWHSKNPKSTSSTTFYPLLGENHLVNLGPLTKSYMRACWVHIYCMI